MQNCVKCLGQVKAFFRMGGCDLVHRLFELSVGVQWSCYTPSGNHVGVVPYWMLQSVSG